jgi:hypothetical protein
MAICNVRLTWRAALADIAPVQVASGSTLESGLEGGPGLRGLNVPLSTVIGQ